MTASLHVWLRVFPQSKIIIALRDPRDIIISCYFQNVALDWANVNFLSLERTAKFYADCMDVWLRLRDLGGFDWIETTLRRRCRQFGSRRKAGDEFPGFAHGTKPRRLS